MSLERLVDKRERFRHRTYFAHQEAGSFAINYLGQHPERAHDSRMITMLEDLQRGAFWGVLYQLDGPADGGLQESLGFGNLSMPDYEAERQKARTWTAANFTDLELNRLMRVTVDLALNPPTIEGRPGYIRGHSTLLRHMVDKPGSIFAEGITEEGRKRLVNGAFWEELGDGYNPSLLSDNLTNHTQDLDPSLALSGIRLYERNRKVRGFGGPDRKLMDMRYFSTEALDTYLGFAKRLNAFGNSDDTSPDDRIDPAVIDDILQPYILAILAEDPDDADEFRFGEKYDLEKDVFVKPGVDIVQRLQDPLVQESLTRSAANRRDVAEGLSFKAADFQFNHTQALELIGVIGGIAGEQILEEIIKRAKSEEALDRLASAMDTVASLKQRGAELLRKPVTNPDQTTVLF